MTAITKAVAKRPQIPLSIRPHGAPKVEHEKESQHDREDRDDEPWLSDKNLGLNGP